MTLKEYAKENAKVLDAKFREKYPAGKFSVQIHRNKCNLHWVNKRNTSRASHLGISNEFLTDNNQLIDRYSQNNSFGKVYIYKTLEDAIKKARKLNFPEELINRFVERYNNREELMQKYIQEERERMKPKPPKMV